MQREIVKAPKDFNRKDVEMSVVINYFREFRNVFAKYEYLLREITRN